MDAQEQYRYLIERRDFDQLTLADAEAAAVAFPDDAPIRSVLAERLLDVGNLTASKAELAKVLAMDPGYAGAYAVAALVCIAGADFEGARNYIEQGFRCNPHDLDVLDARYGLSIVEHDVEGAEKAVDLLEDHLGLHIRVLSKRTTIAFTKDQCIEEAVRNLAERYPGTVAAMTAKSHLSMQLGHCELAVEEAWQAVTLSPTHASSWTVMATALLRSGKLPEAEGAAQKAVDLNPRASNAMRILAMMASSRGDSLQEKMWLDRADESAPWNSRFRDLRKATADMHAGREGGFERVSSLRKSFPICKRPAETALFAYLRNHKKWEQILALADEVVSEGRHRNGRTYAVRVAALRNLGLVADAMRIAEEGLSEFSHVLALRCEFAMTLFAACDPRAKDVMREVSSARPTHPSEGATVPIHLMLEGYLAEADQLLNWAEKAWPRDEAIKKARKALIKFQWARARREPGSLAASLGAPVETTTIDALSQGVSRLWAKLRGKK